MNKYNHQNETVRAIVGNGKEATVYVHKLSILDIGYTIYQIYTQDSRFS